MHITARRIRDGQALADAMANYPGGMTLTRLAGLTGVSFQLIGLLRSPASSGTSGSGPSRTRRYRTSTTPETATAIEEALNCRPGSLFSRVEVADPGDPPHAPEARFLAG